MSRIPSKNTKPEETVRKYLFGQGFRYKKNVSNLPGKPDIVPRKFFVPVPGAAEDSSSVLCQINHGNRC